jgi:hypothetical protein
LIEGLSRANRYECQTVGTQFFITTLVGLEPLLKSIKNACIASYRSKTKTNKVLRNIKLKEGAHKK